MTSALGKWLHHVKSIRLPACRVRPQRHLTIVTGNESCGTSACIINTDLDSATSAIATAYFSSLQTRHIGVYVPLLAIPRADIRLRPELVKLFTETGIDSDDICTLDDISSIDPDRTGLFLVDHNVPSGKISQIFDFENHPARRDNLEGIIDHHIDEKEFIDLRSKMKRYDIQDAGSCGSLVTLYIKDVETANRPTNSTQDNVPQKLADNPAEARGVAQLLLAAILIDTTNLTRKLTPHDPVACQYLAGYIPELELSKFHEDLQTTKLSIEGMTFPDLLRRDCKVFNTPLGKLGMSTITRAIPYLHDMFPDFQNDLVAYFRRLGLVVHVILTVRGGKGGFKRGGMVVTDYAPIIDTFKAMGGDRYGIHEVQVEGIDKHAGGLNWWVFEQGSLNATRKQIAPLMREVIDEVSKKVKGD
jgi:exopolyphosphatase